MSKKFSNYGPWKSTPEYPEFKFRWNSGRIPNSGSNSGPWWLEQKTGRCN